MSKINIQGIVDDMKGHSTVYTPLLEAVVNSIQAIELSNINDGVIRVVFERENALKFEKDALPEIISVKVIDNGAGFNQFNRESFDTFRTDVKKAIGGKGFGRFMFLKYFDSVEIESNYREDDGKYMVRKFHFGRKSEIIERESNEVSSDSVNWTVISLSNLLNNSRYDKNLETIARKLLEKLLIFFIDDEFTCPKIILEDNIGSRSIVLNEFLASKNEIELVHSDKFELSNNGKRESFQIKLFKIYYSNKKSRISLTAQKREVTETALYKYIPEFSDDFYDEVGEDDKKGRRNYIVKTYVTGDYLTREASTERDVFNFPKEKSNAMYPFTQKAIEERAASLTKNFFKKDVHVRSEKKKEQVTNHVNEVAPWHKPYLSDIDLSDFPYNASAVEIESELQKYKFNREQETRRDVQFILSDQSEDYEEKLEEVLSKLTAIGKSDLAHYVSNRKVILEIFDKLLKRRDDGSAEYEEDIHNLIYPMGKDSTNVKYEDHNLWLLDERLVFSHYVASDKKISNKNAPTEPDLVVFDKRRAFRSGDNEFSNPLTIFEFKRPKRTTYAEKDDPINQVINYLQEIRDEKYETPDGVEKIKVNESTPVYGYIIADMCPKIELFAKRASLTKSADGDGYFGYHSGFNIYLEVISFRKLMKDAKLRNKIFFKKLHIE